MNKLVLTVCLFVCFNPLAAQMKSSDKLTIYLKDLNTYKKAMSSVAIWQDGEVLYEQTNGFLDSGLRKSATPQTTYGIGSISKMFTAVMIFQLIDEQKLKPDTRLSTFYPNLAGAEKVTILHLLRHQSGIENFTEQEQYEEYFTKAVEEADFIHRLPLWMSSFEPGSKTAYSNSNYVLLSYIIQKIDQQPYQKSLHQRINRLANLQNTFLDNHTAIDNQSVSFVSSRGEWISSPKTHPSVALGAGSVVSNTSDLCRFMEALMTGKLMSRTSLQQMITLEKSMGAGIFQFPFGSRKLLGHNGSIDGFHSILAYDTSAHTCFCILGNAWNIPMNDVAIAVLSTYYDTPYVFPDFSKARSAEAGTGIEGTYLHGATGMHLEVRKENEQLMAQAEGQSAFPLTAHGAFEFVFQEAGIRIVFIREGDHITGLTLHQSGQVLEFNRE